MSQGDDGTPERPANPFLPAAPPRPGTPGRAKPAPPPPRAAPSDDVDEGWLAPDDVADASLAPATPAALEPTPPAPIVEAPIVEVEVETTELAPAAPSDAEPAKPPSARASESTPASSPVRKGSRAKVLAFVLSLTVVLVGGGLVYRAQMSARSPTMDRAASQSSADTTGRVDPPVPAAEPPPPPTHTVEPPPSASVAKKPAGGAGAAAVGATAPEKADPSKTGILDTTPLPPGRKIIVDGHVVGTSPRKVAVRCGMHRIQIGDLPPESLMLPCGGEITFTD